ncbi:hypothetical protein CCP3SC15_980008 [Gammaproteobacteria bacterium]
MFISFISYQIFGKTLFVDRHYQELHVAQRMERNNKIPFHVHDKEAHHIQDKLVKMYLQTTTKKHRK